MGRIDPSSAPLQVAAGPMAAITAVFVQEFRAGGD
jgi:hypothetical protein